MVVSPGRDAGALDAACFGQPDGTIRRPGAYPAGMSPALDSSMPITTGRLRSYAAVLLVSIALAAPAAAGPAVRIDNFGKVDATLYRGSQPQGQDYADLKALGVKTVVNLTSDDADPNEQALTERAGMAYVQIPMTTHTAPTPQQLAEFLRIVTNPGRQRGYLQWSVRRHRTGV